KRRMAATRSAASRSGHGPSSNAPRAAAIARRTCSGEVASTDATASPVAGDFTMTGAAEPVTHLPFTNGCRAATRSVIDSSREVAAVDGDDRSRRVGGQVGCEKEGGVGAVLRCAGASGRDIGAPQLDLLLAAWLERVLLLASEVREQRRRCDGVDADALLGHLDRQRLR